MNVDNGVTFNFTNFTCNTLEYTGKPQIQNKNVFASPSISNQPLNSGNVASFIGGSNYTAYSTFTNSRIYQNVSLIFSDSPNWQEQSIQPFDSPSGVYIINISCSMDVDPPASAGDTYPTPGYMSLAEMNGSGQTQRLNAEYFFDVRDLTQTRKHYLNAVFFVEANSNGYFRFNQTINETATIEMHVQMTKMG